MSAGGEKRNEQKVDWSTKDSHYFAKLLEEAQARHDAAALKTKEQVEQFILQAMEDSVKANSRTGGINQLNTTLSTSELKALVDNIRQQTEIDIRATYDRSDNPEHVNHYVYWSF